MPDHTYPVAIVGGGPVGLLSALLLARSGVECILFERHSGVLNHPKAMALTGRTVEIFRSLGLEPSVLAGSLDMNGRALAIWCRNLVGETWGTIPLAGDTDEAPMDGSLHCPQTVTEKTLLDALEKEPLASILFDHEVMDCAEHADGRIHLSVRRASSSAIPFTFHSRYLIAADGAASPIRRSLNIQAEGPGDQGHFLNVFFRASYGKHLQHRRAVLYHALDEGRFESLVAVNGDDLWLMHHFLMPGESPADFTHERLAQMVTEASGLPHEPVEILGVSPWVMSPKVAHRFQSGRYYLVGDASARLSPTGGLGMNTGLQGSHNLIWKLASVLNGAPESVLESYEHERRPVALAAFQTADEFRKEVFETIEAGITGDFQRVKSLVASSLRTENPGSKIGSRYDSGAWVPDEFGGTGGLLAPIHVTVDDEVFPITRWMGYQWVLIVAGASSAWQTAADQIQTYLGSIIVRQIGGIEGAGDTEGVFLESYHLKPGGALLVRPDGFVAWVCHEHPTSPVNALQSAMDQIFSA